MPNGSGRCFAAAPPLPSAWQTRHRRSAVSPHRRPHQLKRFPEGSPPWREYELRKGEQLVVEADAETEASIRLLHGSAELHGAELLTEQSVRISEQRLSVFTRTGCRVHIAGEAHCTCSDSAETQMAAYHEAHTLLNERREEAQRAATRGPRVMVVGPKDAGKSGLVRTLVNYALRSGWRPMQVDLDIGQGEIVPPGVIGASRTGLPAQGQRQVDGQAALMYFYGHITPTHSPKHYRFLVKRLANVLEKRAGAEDESAAGLIINTMGWVNGLGYKLLLHSISVFRVDTVLVVGDNKLSSKLSHHFQVGSLSVINLPKSAGATYRQRHLRERARAERLRRYFYGRSGERRPHRFTVSLAELHGRLYRIGFGPKDTLPHKQNSVSRSLGAWPLLPGNGIDGTLRHCVLGISRAEGTEGLLLTEVAGLVYVVDVDEADQTLTYISRCSGGIAADSFLLTGSLNCGSL